MKNKKDICVMCGDFAEYLARFTEEPLCKEHAIIDEQLNYDHGKIDQYGNEIKNGKNN